MQTPSVATLPMDPCNWQKIGFHSLFIYTHVLAEQLGGQSIYGINIIGKPGSALAYPELQSTLNVLGSPPHQWWNDTEIASSQLDELANELFERSLIRIETHEVTTCACGKVEYLAEANLYGTKKSLLKGSTARCCDTVVSTTTKEVLVTAPLPLLASPMVYPSWAHKECTEKLSGLTGRQLLLSRSFSRHHSVEVSGQRWNVDNDLLWWLYGVWLARQGSRLTHLVVGSTTLWHAALITAISQLCNMEGPQQIHCLPKLYFIPAGNIQTLGDAVARFGKIRVIHALLWGALSGRKEFILHGSMFPLMQDAPIPHRIGEPNYRRALLRD